MSDLSWDYKILTKIKTTYFRLNFKSTTFKLYNFDAFKLMESEFDTDETENLNQKFGNRKQTFQN